MKTFAERVVIVKRSLQQLYQLFIGVVMLIFPYYYIVKLKVIDI